MPTTTRGQRLGAELLGTALLLATVIGSGIMGERLAGGNVAIALLGNTIPTGAILIVLITMLGPISGAHFNPAVTMTFLLRKEIDPPGPRLRRRAGRGRRARRARCAPHVRRDTLSSLVQGPGGSLAMVL
jgi:glycerol uptake facilitator-like aquaporin